MCVMVIALVWIFRFQMNGDFWVSNERWLDECSLYRLGLMSMGFEMSHFVCELLSE